MKRALLVSGYIPIPNTNRSEAEYRSLGHRLRALSLPKVMFENDSIEECWLHPFTHDPSLIVSAGDNPGKNTREYHVVQHQKTAWLTQARYLEPDYSVYVWVDYGIFHMPGVIEDIIIRFFERAKDEKGIAIPGCWEPHEKDDLKTPNWRFCGSLLACNHAYVAPFDSGVRSVAKELVQKGPILSWEVNTWATFELRNRPENGGKGLPVRWYKADHNASLFENYQ